MVLAHAGHVIVDIAFFAVPVGTVALLLAIANLRG
jgi:hypothetical protein